MSLFNGQGSPPVLLYGVTFNPSKSVKGFEINGVGRVSFHQRIQSIGEEFGCRSRLGKVSAVSLIKQRQGRSPLEPKLAAC
jgi:hypothetical protein